MNSDLERHIEIYTNHILATIGNPQVLEGWIKKGIAESELKKILTAFYNLGVKEQKILAAFYILGVEEQVNGD
jgi:hypothetical protein